MTIRETGEFALISRITARIGEAGLAAEGLARSAPSGPGGADRAVLLGPGDDGAVVAAPDGRVVATTDVLVAGRHFRQDWASAVDVGHRAAAANLADIAAMGATPTALLVALCAPPDLDVTWVDGLTDGLAAEAATVGARVVGGDLSASPTLAVAVTALGDLAGAAPLTRAGARTGDLVAMAGRIGYAAAGLTVLSRGFRSPKLLVDAYRRPLVPYAAGPAAVALGATAMIDVSDGLLADLGHVAAASGVAIELYRDAFEVPVQMRNAGEALGVDPYDWILTGGDDHPLVATFPDDTPLPHGWQVIGEAYTGSGVTVDGKVHHGPVGWDHFERHHPRGT